jgi:hypothetical protein
MCRAAVSEVPGRAVRERCPESRSGYIEDMGLVKNVVLLGIAKKIYDEARKPENQRRIQEAVASMRAKQSAARGRGTS